MVCICTENQDQASFCTSAPQEVSVLPELALVYFVFCYTYTHIIHIYIHTHT